MNLASVVAGVLSATLFGCGQETKPLPPRHHVKGALFYNGKPAQGATVAFWPLPLNANQWKALKPIAIVEADGSFEPNSYDEKDGAVEGEYALTLIWRATRTSPDIFAGKYNDPAHPVATVKVKGGDNVIAPIQLTGPEISSTPDISKGGQ